MLKLLKPASQEDLFLQRYDALIRRALSLTNNNRAQAEDLVHDAFIQFSLRRAELGAIQNIDAYLNRVLRNMHLSQIRRAAVIEESRLSIADFDSAEMGLRAIDPREHVDVQDDLRQICRYACARKTTSKAGCVLILRFFHSYYPSEIAQVMRTTRTAVDWWIQQARREARIYLNDPNSLRFTVEKPPAQAGTMGYARSTPELLGEMRETIFTAQKEECCAPEQLKAMYRAQPKETIDVRVLSHLVSCARCLDEVNHLLGLPLLTERMSGDRLDRDVPPDNRKSGGSGGNSGSAVESKRRYGRRLKETIEHRPKELRIAVNGFVLGAQQITSEFNKQVLSVNVDEPIGFIEVFSEQNVRMLFFDVDQPIDGTIEQTASAEFDRGRSLNLSLSFRSPWPTLHVTYHDPTFEELESYVEGVTSEANIESSDLKKEVSSPLDRATRFLSLLKHRFEWKWFLRPGTVTALFALILMVAAVLLYRRAPTTNVSATELLQRAVAAEEAIAANRDQVLHRTLQLEERTASGQTIKRNRIEVWHSAANGTTARRLYDDQGTLVAGDWRRSDGVQTIYHHGLRTSLRIRNPQSAISNFEDVWQLDPSGKEFAALTANSSRIQVQETSNSYILSYQASEGANARGIVSASLLMGRSDLHVLQQTLVIRYDSELREFKFIETSFERRSANSVAPAVFEPEPSLLRMKDEGGGMKEVGEDSLHPSSPIRPSPFLATPELELQVLKQLNQANAFFGEQISLSRTPEGWLQVEGIVETDRRKAEVLQSLASLKSNPALQIRIETVAEAAQRQAQRRGTVTTGNLDVKVKSAMPAEADLRAFLSQQKNLTGEALDQEVRRFGERVIDHARQARRHAVALKRIAERFSADDLSSLNESERSQWRAMLAQHARAAQQDLEILRRELQPVFPSLANADTVENTGVAGDADLARAAKRLFELASSVDEAVGRSFSIYATSSVVPVKTIEFARSLSAGVALARTIGSKQ